MSVCDKRIIKINKYFLKEIINKNKYKVIDKYLIWPSVLKTQLRIALLKIKIYNKHYITSQKNIELSHIDSCNWPLFKVQNILQITYKVL